MTETKDQIRERRRHLYADIFTAHYFEALKMDDSRVVIIARRYKRDNGGTLTWRPAYTLEEAQTVARWLTERAEMML